MLEIRQFTLHLGQVEDFVFRVRFDWPDVPDLLLDDPTSFGSQAGPNAARLIAAGERAPRYERHCPERTCAWKIINYYLNTET